jgi:hypothetical protein
MWRADFRNVTNVSKFSWRSAQAAIAGSPKNTISSPELLHSAAHRQSGERAALRAFKKSIDHV